MSRAYLDHASTSPLRPGVVEAMLPWMDAADPGRVHTEGRMARAALEDARDKVAALLGARSREVVFTSGATESVAAAVFGAAALKPGKTIVLTGVEHSCVRDSSARHRNVTTPVDGDGRIDVESLTQHEDAALVHCQWANHEVGTMQPVAEVVDRCLDRDVLVHIDAAAAAGHVPIAFDDLGADLMSVSAHKLGGPKGVGALLIRRGLRLPPLLVGGEQERARRAGLENVAAAVGFGAAAERIDVVGEGDRLRALSERVMRAALAIPGVVAYGQTPPGGGLPHIVCLGVEGIEAEPILLALDQAGIAAHSGSSCSSESLEPSPVLEAMGVDAEHSLRISVGWSTTDADIDRFADAFPRAVQNLRGLRNAQSPQ